MKEKKKQNWLLIVAGLIILILILGAYCIVPQISTLLQMKSCPAGSSGALVPASGFAGGEELSCPSGGSVTCPVCECPECDDRDDGILIIDDCCPDDYTWNPSAVQCYSSRGGASGVCPENSYYDTMLERCVCFGGYVQSLEYGCCIEDISVR